MRRELLVVFFAAVGLYLPTVRYGFVQDDRAIIAANPAAHSIVAAVKAFDDPYWPRGTAAGLYRPIPILTYAVDWTVSGGSPAWLHFMNALWYGLTVVLFVCVVARWLPPLGAAVAGLVFAWHPVHVEAVASVVGRAELLVAVGILGAVLAARRGWWVAAVACAAVAMFSKEHGVIAGVVILLDRWLAPQEERQYPAGFWIALAAVTIGFLAAWFAIGWVGENDAAAIFYGRSACGRLAIALPAVLRAALVLFWPVVLSSDYSPRVIPAYTGFSLAALLGLCIVVTVPILVVRYRRRAPAISFTVGLAALSYLPTSNLLYPSGIALAERNLFLAVAVPAVIVGLGMMLLEMRCNRRPAIAAAAILLFACGARSIIRLPVWHDNRSQLLTLLNEHPESYRAHASAAAVFAGLRDTANARREYRIADSLFPHDPYLDGAHAIYLISVGDTAAAAPLIARRAGSVTGNRVTLRAQFLLELVRHDSAQARRLADSATRTYPADTVWYRAYLQ